MPDDLEDEESEEEEEEEEERLKDWRFSLNKCCIIYSIHGVSIPRKY